MRAAQPTLPRPLWRRSDFEFDLGSAHFESNMKKVKQRGERKALMGMSCAWLCAATAVRVAVRTAHPAWLSQVQRLPTPLPPLKLDRP